MHDVEYIGSTAHGRYMIERTVRKLGSATHGCICDAMGITGMMPRASVASALAYLVRHGRLIRTGEAYTIPTGDEPKPIEQNIRPDDASIAGVIAIMGSATLGDVANHIGAEAIHDKARVGGRLIALKIRGVLSEVEGVYTIKVKRGAAINVN